MRKLIKNKGITLISLVITIIVLIILASVGIYLSLGNNGIFTKAQEAKEKTQRETATEKINLKITTAQMNSYAEKQEMPTLKELSLILKEDSEISYVTEESKVASAEYNVPSDNPSTIYTKLKDYNYEFGINSSLQLASIDGVKVANNDTTEYVKKSEFDKLALLVENLNKKIANMENADIYSTEEKKVGIWIDGKTIYQKTIETTFALESSKWKQEEHNIKDIEHVVNLTGYIINDLSQEVCLNGIVNEHSNMWFTNVTQTNIATYSNYSRLLGRPMVITIQYTKTTDNAN